jgi:hypothetical protein
MSSADDRFDDSASCQAGLPVVEIVEVVYRETISGSCLELMCCV